MLLHAALQPSPRVAMYTDHVIASMGKFALGKGMRSTSYVALQLPHGEDWSEYCRREMAREQEGGVNPGAAADWRKCDMSAADISQVLEERRVANPNPNPNPNP